MDGEAEAAVELVVEDKPLEDVIVTEGTSTFSGIDGDEVWSPDDRLDSYFEPFLAKAVRALFWFLFPLRDESSSRRNLFLSLVSSLSLQDGRLSCRSVVSPARLAFEAIEEVEPEVTPEVTAVGTADVEVDKAVIDEAAEDDPLEGC